MFSKTCIFAHFYLIFFRRNIDLSFRKSSPLRWYSVLKVYLKNVYTRHYFKMRKILTGAKLLLMSIFTLSLSYITKACPRNIQDFFFFFGRKNLKFHWKNFDIFNIIFPSKHTLWVHVTSTHNSCFGSKV